jgi:hypothetical protein
MSCWEKRDNIWLYCTVTLIALQRLQARSHGSNDDIYRSKYSRSDLHRIKTNRSKGKYLYTPNAVCSPNSRTSESQTGANEMMRCEAWSLGKRQPKRTADFLASRGSSNNRTTSHVAVAQSMDERLSGLPPPSLPSPPLTGQCARLVGDLGEGKSWCWCWCWCWCCLQSLHSLSRPSDVVAMGVASAGFVSTSSLGGTSWHCCVDLVINSPA